MRTIRIFILPAVLALTLLSVPTVASSHRAKDDISVAVYTCSGKVCDYLLIGMKPDATDGKDNLYDAVAPAPGMSDWFVSTVIPHPEWNDVKGDFRTDFRSPKRSDTWEALVNTNLPDGTPLTLSIDWEQTKLPPNYAVIVEDMATGVTQAIDEGAFVLPVKTSGIPREVRITIAKKERGEGRH